MDIQRREWNDRQQELRKALGRPADFERAIDLFLRQHAAVHPGEASGAPELTLLDEVWRGLGDPAARRIPAGGEHSIAWVVWHLARIEDVTMNLLLAGEPQVIESGWQARLGIRPADTGNGMSAAGVAELSACIDIAGLRAYHAAVSRRTREVVSRLAAGDLKRRVDPGRIVQVRAAGAVLPEGEPVLDYWAGLTLAGLLLMPPTRHHLVHINEALKLKGKHG